MKRNLSESIKINICALLNETKIDNIYDLFYIVYNEVVGSTLDKIKPYKIIKYNIKDAGFIDTVIRVLHYNSKIYKITNTLYVNVKYKDTEDTEDINDILYFKEAIYKTLS